MAKALNKKVAIALIIFASMSMLFSGCTNKNEGKSKVQSDGKDITVIEDPSSDSFEEFEISSIYKFEDVHGLEWIDENNMLISKKNRELEPVDTGDGYYNLVNLYIFNVSSGDEKSISDKSKYFSFATASPDKKHIFYSGGIKRDSEGYIIDNKHNVLLKITDPSIYNMMQAKWIDEKSLIMPYGEGGFYIANINGEVEKLEDVEKDEYISDAVKVGKDIYYLTQKANERCLKIYDTQTGQKRNVLNDRIVGMEISPDKKSILLEKHELSDGISSLLIYDIEKGKTQELVEGDFIYGSKWSPDGKMIAFCMNSEERGERGLYVIDLISGKEHLISTQYFGYGAPLWNPSGKNISINLYEVKDGMDYDVMHVINIK